MKKLLLCFIMLAGGILPAAEITPEAVNKALGFPLLAGKETWSKDALQKRMGVHFIGNARRFSARYTRSVAGSTPVEVEIHTDDSNKRIKLISFTFANQGDTAGNYKSAITRCRRAITSELNRQLGQKSKGSISDGAFKIKGDMWQNKYMKCILEVDKGDFILFHILPPYGMKEAADPRKKDFSKNVKTNDFGDVYIPNVPMVDQGPKGYCVPATMARIFLYYGIHADMHHLAKIGNTDADDGTYTNQMIKDVKTLRRKANLKMKEFSTVSVKNVARHIDDGHPVMWMMYSNNAVKSAYTFSRTNRKKAASPAEWKRSLKKLSTSSSSDGPHALLIIGYNEKTDEIAVTNSWGAAYIEPQWIPMKVARKASQNHLVVFAP